MRREGRLGGKPSNHSKKTGKCRALDCEQCHESLPLNKSRGKGKGRVKRLVSDIPSTSLLSDWRVSKPSLKMAGKWDPDTDDEDEVEPNDGYGGGTEPKGWALSISLLLDTALEHIQESVDAVRLRKAEEEEAFNASHEGLTTAALENVDDDDESADSWSGIELSDADESDLGDWEDDWSLVGDEVAV